MKLSPTQERLVAWLREHDGLLVRRPGGFWTTPDVSPNQWGVFEPYWSIRTVRALERLGVLARAGRFREEWCDYRVLKEVLR